MKKFIEKITHTIIPHKKNNNIPHLLKEEFIFVLVVFVGVLFYFNQNNFNIIKKLNLTATVYPSVLADMTNHDRATSGISGLTWNTTLEQAAKLKANDMLTNSYFAHTSPSGVTPWSWLKDVNYDFSYAGENLAVDFTESVNVENAWLNSPKHKENIMNSHFTEIGIATADGVFEGKNTTFVVEFFGKPSKIQTVEKPIAVKKVETNNTNIVTPTVAGASTENIPAVNNIKTIQETKDFVVVKNDAVTEESPIVVNNVTNKDISTWYDRFIFSPTNTIKIIYNIIFYLLLLSMTLVLLKEYKKHHTKHIAIGTSVAVLIGVLLYFIS